MKDRTFRKREVMKMTIKQEWREEVKKELAGQEWDSQSPVGRLAEQSAFKIIQSRYPQVKTFFDLK